MTTATNLYQIQNNYQELFEELDQMVLNDDFSPEDLKLLMQQLEINEAELKEKADAYAAVIRRKKSEADFLKSEAKRLNELASAELKKANMLQERITQALQSRGLNKLESAHFRFGFRTSKAVEIISEEMVPESYQAIKISKSPDKMAIKQAIQSGTEIPGAMLVERKSLQIK